jgi:hypothetical protein
MFDKDRCHGSTELRELTEVKRPHALGQGHIDRKQYRHRQQQQWPLRPHFGLANHQMSLSHACANCCMLMRDCERCSSEKDRERANAISRMASSIPRRPPDNKAAHSAWQAASDWPIPQSQSTVVAVPGNGPRDTLSNSHGQEITIKCIDFLRCNWPSVCWTYNKPTHCALHLANPCCSW